MRRLTGRVGGVLITLACRAGDRDTVPVPCDIVPTPRDIVPVPVYGASADWDNQQFGYGEAGGG